MHNPNNTVTSHCVSIGLSLILESNVEGWIRVGGHLSTLPGSALVRTYFNHIGWRVTPVTSGEERGREGRENIIGCSSSSSIGYSLNKTQ